jgi:ferredoxin/flavodoxin
MRGVICYYSGAGNTKLACEYIAARLGVEFDLVDVIEQPDVDLGPYDAVGFAASTDFFGLPRLFEAFMEALPQQPGKPAFVLNTFGGMSGKTLRILSEAAQAKGFDVLAGHSLKMPESYPTMIASGMTAANAPSPRQMQAFDAFIATVGTMLEAVRDGRPAERKPVRLGLLNSVLPTRPRTAAKLDMGDKHVDVSACTECGTCRKNCPYDAITLEPKPVFDESKCYGCWRCYNGCPARAISTKKHAGQPFYAGPSDVLRGKLGA